MAILPADFGPPMHPNNVDNVNKIWPFQAKIGNSGALTNTVELGYNKHYNPDLFVTAVLSFW